MIKPVDQLVMGDRMLATRGIVVEHRHFLSIALGPAKPGVDRALRGARMPAANREIAPFDRMVGELPGKPFVRGIAFRRHEEAGGVFVDPVDDARPRHSADPAKLAAAVLGTVVQQGIHQRAIGVARAGVHHHPGGLVDHDQVRVLEHHRERDILWTSLWIVGGWEVDNEAPPFFHLSRWRGRDLALDLDLPLRDQRLDSLARKLARIGQRLVEAAGTGKRSREGFCDFDGHSLFPYPLALCLSKAVNLSSTAYMPESALPRAVAAAIRTHAQIAAPLECCGLLLGEGSTIAEARPARNVHLSPQTHFEIDPQALIDAHRIARAGGPQVLGYYHSHPRGPAEPSATDRAMAARDGRIWAIVGQDGAIGLWSDGKQGFEALSTQAANR